jgi:FtsZ-binding cell division protein ZapB
MIKAITLIRGKIESNAKECAQIEDETQRLRERLDALQRTNNQYQQALAVLSVHLRPLAEEVGNEH